MTEDREQTITSTNGYFGKVSALASIAEAELVKAHRADDKIKARQGAGKGWLAVGEAFRGLLAAKGIRRDEFPRSERAREAMREYLAEARRLAEGGVL